MMPPQPEPAGMIMTGAGIDLNNKKAAGQSRNFNRTLRDDRFLFVPGTGGRAVAHNAAAGRLFTCGGGHRADWRALSGGRPGMRQRGGDDASGARGEQSGGPVVPLRAPPALVVPDRLAHRGPAGYRRYRVGAAGGDPVAGLRLWAVVERQRRAFLFIGRIFPLGIGGEADFAHRSSSDRRLAVTVSGLPAGGHLVRYFFSDFWALSGERRSVRAKHPVPVLARAPCWCR